ncbi:non-reducing end alpha-L-arabinofuranosidase family hydrolase [Streptomyces sp. NPDC050287]|uniref:non-reducing end alpha-L-arabinofuranosidase family hydrolase n=1 Tax=Streptomyces sp. NPDC050287 TaxID=3365608 RepID=UPI0037BCF26E
MPGAPDDQLARTGRLAHLAGSWTPRAASESNLFARAGNVTFRPDPGTKDISHGEMIRVGHDRKLTVPACKHHYLYQAMNPGASGDRNTPRWRVGLLIPANSTC